MKVLCVTHGKPDYGAAGVLSDIGREEVRLAACYGRGILGETAVVVSVVTSPRARCVETGLIVASELARTTLRENTGRRKDGLWDDVPTTRLRICASLDEPMPPGGLTKAIRLGAEDVEEAKKSNLASKRGAEFEPIVILAVHGDLANAISLKESTYVKANSSAPGLFFDVKGAVVLLDDDSGTVNVLHCAVYDGHWQKVASVSTT